MDNKFYWLKLNKDFFKRHDTTIIESMPNGKDYIIFYLKLLCESIDHEGKLRFSDEIPYNEEMLATITRTNVDVVRSAIKIFTQLNMIEILDDGTYYMNKVNGMIGSAVNNDNANRQRRFREKQKALALCECYESVIKNNESKSIDIEKEKENNNIIITKEKNCSQVQNALFELPLNVKNTFYPITQEMIDHYKELYPNVDIEQNFRNMIGWLEANPTKRKTKTGISRFINAWLSKEQDRGNNPIVKSDNKKVIKNRTNDETEEYLNSFENNIKKL